MARLFARMEDAESSLLQGAPETFLRCSEGLRNRGSSEFRNMNSNDKNKKKKNRNNNNNHKKGSNTSNNSKNSCKKSNTNQS